MFLRLRNRAVLRHLASFAVALLATSAPTRVMWADEVRVSVTDRSAGQNCIDGAVLTAVADDRRISPVETVVARARQPAVLELSNDQAWQLRLRSENCWSTTSTWIPRSANELSLELFSSAVLEGEFVLRAEKPPRTLQASAFRVPQDQNSVAQLAEAEPLDCLLAFPKWTCSLPAELPVDVRLEPQGFAPLYVWNVTMAPAGRRDLGPQKLVAGASVAGWVQNAEGVPLADATLTLASLQPEHPGAARAVATQHRVRSDARGFFQLTGVSPGDYRLVSQAPPLAPAVVTVLTVRPLAVITWPRPLRHSRSVTLRVSIDPARNSDDTAWEVAATELVSLTPGSPRVSTRLSVDADGLWTAAGLRPDRYELVVKDARGSVVDRSHVDLSNGAPATLTLSLHPVKVMGVLKVGDDPLAAADVRFASGSGKSFFVTTDEDGHFEAAFPGPGRWSPLVYPYGRLERTQVRAAPIEVLPQQAGTLELVLPGGRLRGRVVRRDETPVKAAVHVVRDSALVAQRVTNVDGMFDFIGLAESSYEVSAESEDGATPRPLQVSVRADETTDIEMAVDSYRTVFGTIHTPNGLPASGAIVRISTDGGLSWSDLVVGVEGRFEYVVPSGVSEVEILALTYSYPAAMLRIALGDEPRSVTINLLPIGGVLRVEPDRAYLVRGNVVAPLPMFHLPGSFAVMPRVHLEPGNYAVCRQPRADASCRQVLVVANTAIDVSLAPDTGKETAQ